MNNEDYKNAYNKSLLLRGVVLDATVHLERIIDDYLSEYFCYDEKRGNELKEMLWMTERTTLSVKKDLFFMLLDRYHKDFLKQNPKFKTTLENLIPHRNIFAHLEVDMSPEKIFIGEFSFKKYSAGKLSPRVYKNEEIENLTKDFKSVISTLDLIKPPKPSQT